MKPVQVLVFHSHGVGQLVKLPSLPREGETVWSSSWEIGCDGAKGSNVAAALGQLGISTAFIGRIGTDLWSKIGLNWLQDAHVDLSHLIQDPKMSTMIGLVMVDQDGNNSIVLGGDSAHFTNEEIRNGIDAYPLAHYLITGFEMHIPDALEIARYGKEQGKYTILNPSPVPSEDIGTLSFVDLLILNHPECESLLSLKGITAVLQPEEQILQLQKFYQCPNIILTLGKHGNILLTEEHVSFFNAYPVTAVDTSGAGDSFLAAITAGIANGFCLQDSCRFAAQYAAQTVQKPGTFSAFSTLEEMQKLYPSFLSHF